MTEALPERSLPLPPLPANETERLTALHRYKVLDTPPEAAFDRITNLAARLFKLPIALISLVDESRAWFKSCVGFDASEVPRDDTLCSFAVLTDEPLIIPDARLDDRFVCNPFVQSEPGVRFYAGAPLLTQDGFNLGTLCLLDTTPHDVLTDEQKATLVDLAAMVMDELELRLAARRIAQVDAALLEVTQGVSAVTGNAFFSALVQHLTKALGMNYACISLLVNEHPAALKTIAFCAQGEILDDVKYLLQDTPCLEVIRQQKLCYYPQGIQASFPNDDFLAAFGIESYAAIPFFDSAGKPLGLLSVMDSKPLENVQLAQSLLTIFAVRVVAEIERQQAAERLQLYADVVRNAQVGVVVWQLEDLNNPGSFRLLIANSAASATTGFDFEPLIGTTMAESFPMLLQTPLAHQYMEVVRIQQAMDLGEVPYSEDGIVAGIYSLKAFPLPNDCLGLAFENITARKRIETQLQESQRYNQQIAETMPGVLFVYDLLEQRTVYTNHQIADFLGYTSEQVQAMGADTLPTLIHPDDLQRMFQYLEDFGSVSESTVLGIEYQAHHANGEWRWMYSQSVVFKRTVEGLVHQILGVSIDITDRKQAEQERERFLVVGSDLQVITGNNGYFQWVSPSFEHILGWTPAEMTARPWTEFIHPDDIDPSLAETSSLFSGNETFRFENRYRHKDGTYRWLLWNAQLSSENQVLYGTAIDITDRKQAEETARQSEEQTRLAIQVAQLGTWRCDLGTGLVELDERMHQIWGKSEDVATIPLPQVIEQIHPDDRARVEHAVVAALDPKSSGTYEIEYRIVWDDGSERWIAANGQAQFEGEGKSRHPVELLGTALDITERRQAEVALAAQEQRYRYIFEAVSVSIWEEDFSEVKAAIDQLKTAGVQNFHQYFAEHPEFVQQAASKVHLRDVNQASLRMFGAQDKAELLGSLDQIFVPETQEAFAGELLAIATEASFFATETVLQTLQGARFDVWVTITFPPKAEPYDRVLVSLVDISDRKQTEAALRNSAERLSVALAASKLGDWSWDAATDLVTFSDQAAKLFGIPPGPHMTWRQMQTLLHEDDQERARLQVEQAIAQHSDYDVEYRVIQPSGSERWVAAKGRAQYGPSEQVIGMLGVVQDITDRKQAEQEREHLLAREQSANQTLQRFIEHTPTAVVMLDQEMRYLFASRRWMQEYAPTYTNLRGLSHYEVMSDIPQHWREVHQRCLAGATERCEEDYYVRANGSGHWLHWEILPWYDSEGDVGGIILFAENITERKQANQEREHLLERERAAREAAETANRVKDEFLAVLSHELRSPLNPILGWATLLLNNKLDEAKTTQALATIQRNAKLQSELIEDLLDVSRILQGKLSLNVAPVNLASTIRAAMETVRLAAEAKSITVDASLSLDVGLVSGDATRLQQVIWNLLSNAVKFTPKGGQVTIHLERFDSYAHLTVSDTGQGIAPDFLPHVFDYFRQANAATTRRFGGLGLGLAIVRHLVELHGGTVGVESPGEGQGATFTVKLPLMPIQATANEHNQLSELGLDLNGIRVLVVDDEPDSREFVAFVLEQAGAKVIIATTADDALTTLIRSQPNVLLSDIGMPDVDGYMLMQQVRALPPEQGGQIPAVALTAYAGEMNQQQALQAGFQRHVSKPVEPEVLVGAIARLLDNT